MSSTNEVKLIDPDLGILALLALTLMGEEDTDEEYSELITNFGKKYRLMELLPNLEDAENPVQFVLDAVECIQDKLNKGANIETN